MVSGVSEGPVGEVRWDDFGRGWGFTHRSTEAGVVQNETATERKSAEACLHLAAATPRVLGLGSAVFKLAALPDFQPLLLFSAPFRPVNSVLLERGPPLPPYPSCCCSTPWQPFPAKQAGPSSCSNPDAKTPLSPGSFLRSTNRPPGRPIANSRPHCPGPGGVGHREARQPRVPL